MIRPATVDDAERIHQLGASVYPHHHFTSLDSIRTKLAGYPAGCFVVEVEGEFAGYCLSFPYELGLSFPWDADVGSSARHDAQLSCHYIHDLCIGLRWRGRGLAEALVGELFRIPLWPKALTTVTELQGFWRNFGFQEKQEVNCAGSRCVYMVKY